MNITLIRRYNNAHKQGVVYVYRVTGSKKELAKYKKSLDRPLYDNDGTPLYLSTVFSVNGTRLVKSRLGSYLTPEEAENIAQILDDTSFKSISDFTESDAEDLIRRENIDPDPLY